MAEYSDNMEPELVETVLNTPVSIEAYCSASIAIDRGNKQRQDNRRIERNIRTKYW